MRPKRARRHVEPCENAVDYEDVTRDLRAELANLRQAYETLSTNRDKEATEAARKLQQTIEELQVAARKKDDEIGRLRAEAVEPKNKVIRGSFVSGSDVVDTNTNALPFTWYL